VSAGAALAPRLLGRTGLEVTPVCMGCAQIGNMAELFGPVPEEQALALLRAFFASPLTFFDTSAAYGDGESERRIGLAIKERGGLPPGFVLATKADRDLATGDFSGEQTRRSVERSLRLLGVERLPLVHIHDPEYATTSFEAIMGPGGALEVLRDYQRQGVIGAIGIAAGPIDMMTRYVATGAFDAVLTHNRYTLVERSAEPLIALAAAQGMAVLNAAPYGSGMLAKGPDGWPKYMYHEAPPELVERVRRMDEACREHGVPLAAAALQFSLRDPRVHATVVGMAKPERVAQTVELARHPIPAELWPRLDAIYAGAGH
jgi:D-threo-aldose 1-dehydrogenase